MLEFQCGIVKGWVLVSSYVGLLTWGEQYPPKNPCFSGTLGCDLIWKKGPF